MTTAKDFFDAGHIVGRLQGAVLLPIDKSELASLEKTAKSALDKIGLTVGVLDSSALGGLLDRVRQTFDAKESSCFELGLNIPPLQINLVIASSAASNPKISDGDLSQIISILKPLIDMMEICVARIGALDMARSFLDEVRSGVSGPRRLRQTAKRMQIALEIFKALLKEWLEAQPLPMPGEVNGDGPKPPELWETLYRWLVELVGPRRARKAWVFGCDRASANDFHEIREVFALGVA